MALSNFVESNNKKDQRQKRLLEAYRKKQAWMKWAIIAGVVIILLLLLLLGLATDWTRGLRKDTVDTGGTPINSSLDSLQADGATPANTATVGTDTATNNRTATGGTNTVTERSSSTTNTSTTTNNTTTNTVPGSQTGGGLVQLYGDTAVGDDLTEVFGDADLLSVSKECRTEVVIQVCDFREGDRLMTVRSIAGTDIITGITKNF